jgi:type II secretory pathway pseudopilin PulG
MLGLPIVFLILAIAAPFVARSTHGKARRLAETRLVMAQFKNAICSYESEYGFLPSGTNAAQRPRVDFVFGTHGTGSPVFIGNPQGLPQANNSDLVAILADLTEFRNGQATVNSGHVLNRSRLAFLQIREVKGTAPRGVGEDGVYRDAWGNPYFVTLDSNGDGFCDDPLYGRVRDKIVIWSFGPDGKADLSLPPGEGVNRDNLSTTGLP